MAKRKIRKAKLVIYSIGAVLIISVCFSAGVFGEMEGAIKSILITFGIIGAIVGLIVGILNLPVVKGKIGEKKISKVLKRAVGKTGYVIDDVIIPGENGRTSQIDHIAISRTGIHVVETKNYSGRIYGDEDQQFWTQVLAYGRTKNKLYNPLKQNYTHICNLSSLIDDDECVFGYVVFVRGNIEYIDSDKVFTPRDLKNYIRKGEGVLSDELIEKYYLIIKSYKDNPIQTNKEHIKEIKNTLDNIENNICPRCGGRLVERDGKNGKFYGCSNYPGCKFTKKY